MAPFCDEYLFVEMANKVRLLMNFLNAKLHFLPLKYNLFNLVLKVLKVTMMLSISSPFHKNIYTNLFLVYMLRKYTFVMK